MAKIVHNENTKRARKHESPQGRDLSIGVNMPDRDGPPERGPESDQVGGRVAPGASSEAHRRAGGEYSTAGSTERDRGRSEAADWTHAG